MKILVCMKQVPDTTEVRLNADFTLEREFIAHVMNPADESALELALRLQGERGGTVTVLSMGPAHIESMLRDAISRGAHEAVALTDAAFAGSDTLATAKALCAAIKALGGFDLILCGRRAVDGETGQVGPMLAALLNIGCVANATDVRVTDNAAEAHQLLETGVQVWRGRLPLLITLCEWSHRLRLPTLMGLKNAAHSRIRLLKPTELGLQPTDCGLIGSPTRVMHVSARPTGVRPCRILDTSDELMEVLP